MNASVTRRRFFCDDHLLRLCRWLRAAGYDVAWERAIDDGVLLERARAEGRVVLTLDRGIARRRLAEGVVHVLSSHEPERQLAEVTRAWELDLDAHAFTRCTVCNVALQPGKDEDAPPRVRARCTAYRGCPVCGRTYWEGTHVRKLRRVFDRAGRARRSSSRIREACNERSERDGYPMRRRPPDR